MLKENSKLREEALGSLKDHWKPFVIMCAVYMAISYASSALSVIPIIGQSLMIFVVLPVSWGFEVALLEKRRGHKVELPFLFSAFQQYSRILITKFLQFLYISLWAMLLVVPGIMKAYSYAMTSYILKDEPTLSDNAAIERSMAMMEGHKMKLFLLDLSFVGWILLAILTLGIGMLWVAPYMNMARACFYEDLKKEKN